MGVVSALPATGKKGTKKTKLVGTKSPGAKNALTE